MLTIFGSWDLGTCIPERILDTEGYVSQAQGDLENLSLITDGTCAHAGSHLEGLPWLKNLRNLSWQGIHNDWDIPILRKCLEENQMGLQALHLYVSNRPAEQEINELEFAVSRSAIRFPSLQSLSLSNFIFPRNHETTMHAFNMQSLHSLALRGCAYQYEFLQALVQSRQALELKAFELCSDGLNETDTQGAHAAAEFLLSFTGLESLHLQMSNTRYTMECLKGPILHQQSLVYHERELAPLGNDGLFEETRDAPTSWAATIPQTLNQCDLRFLGLCLSPSSAVSCSIPGPDVECVRSND